MTTLTERWIDAILRFDFTPVFLPGEENGLADALSRSYEGGEEIFAPSAGAKELEDSIKALGADIDHENRALGAAMKRGKKIPQDDEKKRLIQETHALGHFSIGTMYQKLWDQGYWWPKMRDDLKQHVHTCIDCLRYDIKEQGYHLAKSVKEGGSTRETMCK